MSVRPSEAPTSAPPRTLRHRLAKTALGVAVFAALLLVPLEIFVRWAFPVPELLGFTRLNYAGSLVEHLSGPVPALGHLELWWWSEPDGAAFTRTTNRYGFCDREWTLAKTAGHRRIAFVGDSFVEGLGAGDGETMTAEFARQARGAPAPVDPLNWGAAGFGLANYARLLADATPAFHPDDVVLVLYTNDFYQIPGIQGLLEPSGTLRRSRWWQPWTPTVLAGLSTGRNVTAWILPTGVDGGPRPIDVAPRFAADPDLLHQVERFVEPGIAAQMKAGRMNPAMTNLLDRSVRVLPNPVEIRPYLGALRGYLARHGARLWVTYLPSMNQVSDAYLPAQRRISAPIDEPTLTTPRFQQHARDTAAACADLGIPFLDLTPALSAAESGGARLYWPYDGHMNRDGYRFVGRELWAWWQRESADGTGRSTGSPGAPDDRARTARMGGD